MTTPTRDQLIEQAIQGHAGTRMAMQWLFDQAIKEGRAQGLREAAALARSEGIAGISSDDDEIVAEWLDAAAIEQLRGE